jgi:predicted nuclease of restriction endonuclease-like (RecB) superfamily
VGDGGRDVRLRVGVCDGVQGYSRIRLVKPRPTKQVKKGARVNVYQRALGDIAGVIEAGRESAARSVNTIMTAAYWIIGRRIVELEQQGSARALYGEHLLERLSGDLSPRYGRGFSAVNLRLMRRFYLGWPSAKIRQTLSIESPRVRRQLALLPPPGRLSIRQTVPVELTLVRLGESFPLPWSDYVRLMQVENPEARAFYEAEAVRSGWSLRQLDRQISTLFYERSALSRKKAEMLHKGGVPRTGEVPTIEQQLKDPFFLEFLDLKDEYSESDLEDALIRELEKFLLELGGDFTFVGRQRRLRIGGEWYRVDLIFFHRRLHCLVIIDLKVGKFTHSDVGQMHMYLNYAGEHWANPGEKPPVGLILCTDHNAAVARYALQGLPNCILTAEYRTVLPNERKLTAELERTRRLLEDRYPVRMGGGKRK